MARDAKPVADTAPGRRAAEHVDQARLWRHLMDLATCGATGNGGVNRQALSAEDAAARQMLVRWGVEIGLRPFTDEIGNLYLRRPGTDSAAAPVLTGSHLDSQPTGGKFDGAYGVMAGLEALYAIHDAGIDTVRPIEVVAWTNEEGSRFQPGTMGSGVFTGRMRLAEVLAVRDRAGITVAKALDSILTSTPKVPTRPGGFPVAAYLEAHIEQGPLLEQVGKPIGVVRGVQGLRWFAVEVRGEAAHAGTTPRRHRKDALSAATAMVTALQAAMHDDSDTVRFTIGRFEVEPGSPNTVPARVFFTIDLRHPEEAVLDRLSAVIAPLCQANAGACTVSVEPTALSAATVFDPAVVDAVDRWRRELGLAGMEMVSGAGHDAVYMALVCPSGMIFVPCAGGVSHNEIESAKPDDLAAGARVLTATMVDLANR